MASPFALFRKNQKILMAVFGIMAMIAFVFLDTLGSNNAPPDSAERQVVAETKDLKLTGRDINAAIRNRSTVQQFLGKALAAGAIRRQDLQIQATNKGVAPAELQEMREQSANAILGDCLRAVTQLLGSTDERTIVETLVLADLAKRSGVQISDQRVMQFIEEFVNRIIAGNPAAGLEPPSAGQLDQIAAEVKSTTGLSQRGLYDAFRTELLAGSLREAFVTHPAVAETENHREQILATPIDRWDYYTRKHLQATVDVVAVRTSDYVDAGKVPAPSESQLMDFFDKYKFQEPELGSPEPGFKIPQQAAFQYFAADEANFQEPEKVTAAEIAEHYEKNKARYPYTPEDFSLPAKPEPSVTPPTNTPQTNTPSTSTPPSTNTAPSASAVPSATPTTTAPVAKPTPTATPTASPAASAPPAATAKPTPSATPAPAASSSASASATTATPSATPKPTPSATAGAAASGSCEAEIGPGDDCQVPGATATASQTGTKPAASASPTASATATSTATTAPTPTASPSTTPSASASATAVAKPAATPSASAVASPAPAATPTPSASPSATAAGTATAVPAAVLPPAELPTDDVMLPDDVRNGRNPQYDPLWRVEGKIRKELAEAAGRKRITEIFAALRKTMSDKEANRPIDVAPDEKQPPLFTAEQWSELAKPYPGVVAKTTDVLSSLQVRAEAKNPGLFHSTISGFPFAEYVFVNRGTYFPTESREIPEVNSLDAILKGRKTVHYLFWKTTDVPARVPDFKEYRGQVELAWKNRAAREMAEKDAAAMAKKAAESSKPLVELFPEAKRTNQFSWFKPDLSGGFAGRQRATELSEVDYVEDAGPEFMEAVFSLTEGEVATAFNNPKTVCYVIRAVTITPPRSQLYEMFAVEPFDLYEQFGRRDVGRLITDAEKALIAESGLKWLREPRD